MKSIDRLGSNGVSSDLFVILFQARSWTILEGAVPGLLLIVLVLTLPRPLAAQDRTIQIGDWEYFRHVTFSGDRSFIQTFSASAGLGLVWQCDSERLRVRLSSRDRFKGTRVSVTYSLGDSGVQSAGVWSPAQSGLPAAPASTTDSLTRAASASDSIYLSVRTNGDSAAARLGLQGFSAALSRLPCGR